MITQQLRSKLLKAFLHWESDCGLWPVGVWGLLAASVRDGAQTGRGGGGRGRVTVPNINQLQKPTIATGETTPSLIPPLIYLTLQHM